MRAIERTTAQFVAAVRAAVPDLTVTVERSVTRVGRSNYVHLRDRTGKRYWKVRISDHQVGMRRARSGSEAFYLHARATPDRWTLWLCSFRREFSPVDDGAPASPIGELFGAVP